MRKIILGMILGTLFASCSSGTYIVITDPGYVTQDDSTVATLYLFERISFPKKKYVEIMSYTRCNCVYEGDTIRIKRIKDTLNIIPYMKR